jgi:hypothetical protein
MKVYTEVPTPFRFYSSVGFIRTEIEEYERISIGHGYYGILFKNIVADLWHMAQEDCGALIGSDKSKAKLIKSVKQDVKGGSPKLMKQQIKMGKSQMIKADFMERTLWFRKFRKSKSK